MTERPTPNWQPLSQLPLIASHIDAMVEGAAEQYQNLEAARPKPYVLDDYTVERVIKVFTTQQDDLWLFEEQLRRWTAVSSAPQIQQEIERLNQQLVRLRSLLKAILALAEELKAGTIEKQLAKSDLEVGLEALLGKWSPPATRPKPKRKQ